MTYRLPLIASLTAIVKSWHYLAWRDQSYHSTKRAFVREWDSLLLGGTDRGVFHSVFHSPKLRAGRHWIGGERGGKGGAMRAQQKWLWHDSIFSCDCQWSRRMRSFLFCYNSFSLSWSASYNLQRTEDFLYLTRNKKISRQFLLSWFGFEIEELPHNHPNTSFLPRTILYNIVHYCTLRLREVSNVRATFTWQGLDDKTITM